jgi:hypothetical protein
MMNLCEQWQIQRHRTDANNLFGGHTSKVRRRHTKNDGVGNLRTGKLPSKLNMEVAVPL